MHPLLHPFMKISATLFRVCLAAGISPLASAGFAQATAAKVPAARGGQRGGRGGGGPGLFDLLVVGR